MAKKKLSSSSALVYSTDPFLIKQQNNEEVGTLPPGEQKLLISLDKKHRAGKVVTLVAGFVGKEEELEELSKKLKSFCGTGGSVKDGIIIIQGDNREKIIQKLNTTGYKQIRKI